MRDWVHARDPNNRRRRGYLYLTSSRLIASWVGRGDGHAEIEWSAVESWGVARDARGGPRLAVESAGDCFVVQIPAEGSRLAGRASGFLSEMAKLAPRPVRSLAAVDSPSDYDARSDMSVTKSSRSMAEQVWRLAVTVLGIGIIVTGLVLMVLPGPGVVVTIVGLVVLAIEHFWAQDILIWARERSKRTTARLRARRSSRV